MVNIFKGEFNLGSFPIQEFISPRVPYIPEIPQFFPIQDRGPTHGDAKVKTLVFRPSPQIELHNISWNGWREVARHTNLTINWLNLRDNWFKFKISCKLPTH